MQGNTRGARRSRSTPVVHNYRLLVEYDGTRYAGFQVQPAARTVAGELGAAVAAAIGRPLTLIAAGRTDAGVHAEGQVVNFLSTLSFAPHDLRERLNDRLPADVNVLEVVEVDPDFHARSHAVARHYRYQLSTRRDAFRKRWVWWVRSPVEERRLADEAESVVGSHDFASFTDAGDEETVVRVVSARWERDASLVVFRVVAERFLYRMVRRLVGTMVEVALRREAPGTVARLLAEPRAGAAAPWTAPPSGLFLERIEYLGDRL